MDLYGLARPLLFRLDAERAHRLVLRGAGFVSARPWLLGLAARLLGSRPDPRLAVRVFGLDFPSPVGLAAGLDKDGEAIDFWGALGFGFMELGTVTPGSGQPGNEPPRLERLVADRALVNRMGFNNHGAQALVGRLAARRCHVPVGVNLGKAKVTPIERAAEDYVECLRVVWAQASYIVVNVSSPNTPNLRDLQAVSQLRPLLSAVQAARRALEQASGLRRPVLLKIAPDLADDDVDAVADLALELELDGLIATNTTLRLELARTRPRIQGGLSGAPLLPRALELVRRLYRRLGPRLPIVGVGGISSAADAWERMEAGASLVQVYSALVYQGPRLVGDILRGLADRLRREGCDSMMSIVGRRA